MQSGKPPTNPRAKCAYTNASAPVRVDLPVASVLHIIAYVIISATSTYICIRSFKFYPLSWNRACTYATIFNIFISLSERCVTLSNPSHRVTSIMYMCMRRCVSVSCARMQLPSTFARGHALPGTRMHLRTPSAYALTNPSFSPFTTIITRQ